MSLGTRREQVKAPEHAQQSRRAAPTDKRCATRPRRRTFRAGAERGANGKFLLETRGHDNIRFARFAQASSRTKLTAPSNTISAGRTFRIAPSCSEVIRAPQFILA
jgi:hypothetical protein